MTVTEGLITLATDTYTNPATGKRQYGLDMSVWGHDDGAEVYRFMLPTFEYGRIVVRLCDRWIALVRNTLLPEDAVSEEQAGILLDLFLAYRAIAADFPGVPAGSLDELVLELVGGAMSLSVGERADDVLVTAISAMRETLPSEIFHDPTDLFATTAGEAARPPSGIGFFADALAPPRLRAGASVPSTRWSTTVSLVSTRPPADIVTTPPTAAPALSVSVPRDEAGAARVRLVPGGCVVVDEDTDDDMPALLSPTSSELDVGDW